MDGTNILVGKKKKTLQMQWPRARLVYVFKNWKLLFENFCGNMCGWKSVCKCVKCCLKTKNGVWKHKQNTP